MLAARRSLKSGGNMRNTIYYMTASVLGAVLTVACDTGSRTVTQSQSSAASASSCRSRDDCRSSFEFCLPPGEFAGCGICFIGDGCTSDSACQAYGPEYICDSAPCSCPGHPICVAGCTSDASCRTGQSCGGDHRCSPSACQADPDCPTNFVCAGANGQHCARRACSSDIECEGYCVNGNCYDALGTCTQPPV